MKKISYIYLQRKYPRKIVALDRKESKVVAFGLTFSSIFKKLQTINVKPKECVFIGPIQKKGTINVYLSLRIQTYR